MKVLYFPKNAEFLQKTCDISKIKIYYLKLYIYVCTYVPSFKFLNR